MASWERAYLKTLIQIILSIKVYKINKNYLYKAHHLYENKQAQITPKEFCVIWPAGFNG